MFKKIMYSFIFLAVGLNSAYAGVQIGATRLVYDGDKNQASIAVSNSEERPYLIQSWVSTTDTSNDSVNDLFVTTPPIFRLDAKSSNSVRVVYTGSTLPQDRESVFWLNIKSIPSTSSDNTQNNLVITIRSQIKLFYRPATLPGNPDDAYSKLQFFAKNGKLEINNPTPYSVTIQELTVNGKAVDNINMILPFSTQIINKNVTVGNSVGWTAINDYGGTTSIENAIIK